MAGRRGRRDGQAVGQLVRAFLALPAKVKIVVGVALAVGVVLYLVAQSRRPERVVGPPVPPGTVVFMFWNVENLFDDRNDKRRAVDEEYDDWFAEDANARRLKYDHLAEIILRVNGGNGPHILAGCEVESVRAAELLRDTLNVRLPAGATRYTSVAMRELTANAGRYMAPCVISKLPLDEGRTRLLGSRNLRILETHVVANAADLTLVASHWTSQLSDDGKQEHRGRDRYAEVIYAEYERIVAADPDADFLVCGDFNTTPDSEPVAGELHMTVDRAAVVPGAVPPRLFGLLSGKPPAEYGTLVYNGRPLIYDQVGVSAGLLDGRGWACDPDSVTVPTDGMTRGGRRPWRFGNRSGPPTGGRGYADHFPVVVNLRLAP
ncbi:MAG: endonuclease/exonuclease/phosphatase family protein [Gemmataceae bacterium]|nr:endonuclease/exonuclease/phosphatase family protein [Gemmataceae bacterium]